VVAGSSAAADRCPARETNNEVGSREWSSVVVRRRNLLWGSEEGGYYPSSLTWSCLLVRLYGPMQQLRYCLCHACPDLMLVARVSVVWWVRRL
jgi:hypothetical protein